MQRKKVQFLRTLQGYRVLCANKACWFGNKLKQRAAGALLHDFSFFKKVCWKCFRRRDVWVKSLNVSTGRPDTELLPTPEPTPSFKTEEIHLWSWESLSGSRGVPEFSSEPLVTEKQEIVIWNHGWVGEKKILFPCKLDWRRRVVGYWLTKFSTLSLMKLKSAWISTVHSPLLLLEECKICYPARGQSKRCWQILQQVLKIHHIVHLFFFPQATLTMSTMSCSIPWITLCQPGIEIITIQPLPLCSDQFYQENA